jgi:hypothetical protein
LISSLSTEKESNMPSMVSFTSCSVMGLFSVHDDDNTIIAVKTKSFNVLTKGDVCLTMCI